MIVVNNLTKVYKLSKKQMMEQRTKNIKRAVNELSLTAKPGRFMGF